jgi:hypothetical protein
MLLLFVGILAVSCREQKKSASTGSDVKEVTFKEAPKDFLIASSFKNIHMIQLEAKEECLISDTKRVVDVEGKVYVLTRTNEIFCFDRATGKYIRTIGRLGEGPGEYVSAMDICYDEKEKCICVVDYYKSAIHNYSLDGRFLGDRKFDEETAEGVNLTVYADCAPDGNMLLSLCMPPQKPSRDYVYMMLRPDGTSTGVDVFSPVRSKIAQVEVSRHPIAKSEDGLRFFKFMNDTIFTLSGDEVVPFCKLNLGRKMVPKDVLAKMGPYEDVNAGKLYQSGYSLPLFELYEDKNYILVLTKPLTLQGRENYLINKKTLEGIHIKGSALMAVEAVMFLEGRLMPDIIDSNRNEFISWFAPIWIECMRDEIFAKNLDVKLYKKEMRTFFEKADPEGNPCLVFYEN